MSYGKVYAGFWTDEKMVEAPDDAKIVALYLLTGPHRNLIGCFRCPIEYIVGDLRWPIDRVSIALLALSRMGFLVRDDRSGWTLICNQLKYDSLGNDKHAKAAARLALDVPKSLNVFKAMREKLMPHLDRLLKGQEGIAGYPIDTPSIGTPSPEPSPEPSPLPEPGVVASPLAPPPSPATTPAKPQKVPKGSRLPSDWALSDDLRAWTQTELLPFGAGIPAITAWIERAAKRFENHWRAASGKTSVKSDWDAAWRTWVLKDIEDGRLPVRGSGDDPVEPERQRAPNEALRDATPDEKELARRLGKFCGSKTTNAEVAGWRQLDNERPNA